MFVLLVAQGLSANADVWGSDALDSNMIPCRHWIVMRTDPPGILLCRGGFARRYAWSWRHGMERCCLWRPGPWLGRRLVAISYHQNKLDISRVHTHWNPIWCNHDPLVRGVASFSYGLEKDAMHVWMRHAGEGASTCHSM